MRRWIPQSLMVLIMLTGTTVTSTADPEALCTIRLVGLVDGRIVPLPDRQVPCTDSLPVPAFIKRANGELFETTWGTPRLASRFEHYYWLVYLDSSKLWVAHTAQDAQQVLDGHEERFVLDGNSRQLDTITKTANITTSISVQVNGTLLPLDPPAFLENNRTLVPMRAIFEALGAIVTWDDATQTVTGTRGATVVKLRISSTTAWVNDQAVPLDVPARLVNDRTFVPARFVAEALGATVNWDEATQTVLITDAQ